MAIRAVYFNASDLTFVAASGMMRGWGDRETDRPVESKRRTLLAYHEVNLVRLSPGDKNPDEPLFDFPRLPRCRPHLFVEGQRE